MKQLPAALLLLPLLAGAQSAPQPETRVTFGVEHNNLDNGYASWTDVAVGVGRRWTNRQFIEGTLLETRRFDVKDTQVGFAFAAPLSQQVTLSGDATVSPTRRVLARHGAGAALQYEFAPTWLVHGGLRHASYEDTDAMRGTLMLEHYFGNFSASVAWYPGRAFDTNTNAFDLRGSWYYNDLSSFTLLFADGDEVTLLGPGSVALADVRSAALFGRHALGPRTWLTWSLFHVRQGSFYTRHGASAGVQIAF